MTQNEIDNLKLDLKTAQYFAELWYFVMDEIPLEFEKIVCTCSPANWMDEAVKLKQKQTR